MTHLATQETAVVHEFWRMPRGPAGCLQLGRDLVKRRIDSIGQSMFVFNLAVQNVGCSFLEERFVQHKVNRFKMNDSVAPSTLTMLHNHHLYLVLEHFYQFPKWEIPSH